MINENSTKEQVLKAVKQDWLYLQYASEALRGDKEVVLKAVQQGASAYCLLNVGLPQAGH